MVFGALHFEGVDAAMILPVIAVFGVGLCLIYERTGSLFAVIAIHAAFNTVATPGHRAGPGTRPRRPRPHRLPAGAARAWPEAPAPIQA